MSDIMLGPAFLFLQPAQIIMRVAGDTGNSFNTLNIITE
jgi:hypothetical protein